MKKIHFDILYEIYDTESFDVSLFAMQYYKDIQMVLDVYKELEEEGYISHNKLTSLGQQYLSSFKIDNAVILAAGQSTRFVPLSFEKPKGLLTVRGEVLIERQIRQLHEKGIEEIYIVVGHQKELFYYLVQKFHVKLIETDTYKTRNNHASIFAAKEILKNTIVTSSDLYFTENIFQSHAYDSYYTCQFVAGKSAERGVVLDEDDKIIETFYGDKCFDNWVTLGYAYFSSRFSREMIDIIDKSYELEETYHKFWADLQDEYLERLYMYAKFVKENVIYEFDSLEELRSFDEKYINSSGSKIMKEICYVLGGEEQEITNIETAKTLLPTMFKFKFRENDYLCNIVKDDHEKYIYMGRCYYQCRDMVNHSVKLFKMDKYVCINGKYDIDIEQELKHVFHYCEEFQKYHNEVLPLCAAENVISPFANLPLSFGFQERYIMNNTYSFNMNDNFIGCEKLFPFYEKISEVCERLFSTKYTDCRPFTGMHCIDMVVKTLCSFGDKIMLLGSRHGGHASVKPVVERLGLEVVEAPYDMENQDLDYLKLNTIIEQEHIPFILLAPSDIIKPFDIKRICTSHCTLLYDCSQLLGFIAGGLLENPLESMDNIVMFAGTHKTFPGPASGLILTNSDLLHQKMETVINPIFLRHSQMHQKISLLFALLEFEQFGSAYMSHVVHCANYLGNKLKEYGVNVMDNREQLSFTHQIFIHCSCEEEMNQVYDNAYQCGVTLNKKHKELFEGFGIRLGVQEIARYDWNDKALDDVAYIVSQLFSKDICVEKIRKKILSLPAKEVKYTFSPQQVEQFFALMSETN